MSAQGDARGLVWWSDAIRATDGQITPALRTEIAARARFSEASRVHLRTTLAMQASNPMVQRLANDGIRLMLAYLALYMDARSGLTRQAARELCVELDLSSPGRAAAMVMQLRLMKFIEAAPEQPDRRTKLYVPTVSMKNAYIELMNAGLAATAILEPEAADLLLHFAEPVFFKGFVLAMGDAIVKMIRNLAGEPRNMFADATAGHMMLYRTALGSDDTVYPPRGAMPFVAAALAKEFRVSRSHVRRTFDRAAERDFVRYGADRKTIALTEPFRTELTDLHAAMFANNIRCICAAQAFARGQGT